MNQFKAMQMNMGMMNSMYMMCCISACAEKLNSGIICMDCEN